MIKSFKWLATATEYDTAIEYVNSLPEPTEGGEAETIEQAIEEQQALEAEKKTVKYKVRSRKASLRSLLSGIFVAIQVCQTFLLETV